MWELQVSWPGGHEFRRGGPALCLLCMQWHRLGNDVLLPSLITCHLWQAGELSPKTWEQGYGPVPHYLQHSGKQALHLAWAVELALVMGVTGEPVLRAGEPVDWPTPIPLSPRSRALNWLTLASTHQWTTGVHEGVSPTNPKLHTGSPWRRTTTGYPRRALVRFQHWWWSRRQRAYTRTRTRCNEHLQAKEVWTKGYTGHTTASAVRLFPSVGDRLHVWRMDMRGEDEWDWVTGM